MRKPAALVLLVALAATPAARSHDNTHATANLRGTVVAQPPIPPSGGLPNTGTFNWQNLRFLMSGQWEGVPIAAEWRCTIMWGTRGPGNYDVDTFTTNFKCHRLLSPFGPAEVEGSFTGHRTGSFSFVTGTIAELNGGAVHTLSCAGVHDFAPGDTMPGGPGSTTSGYDASCSVE